MRKLSTFFTFLLIFAGVVFSQTTTLSTFGVSPRDASNNADDLFDMAYNGLTNVGMGTKIYLKGSIDEGSLMNPTWTISSKPVGSDVSIMATADIDSATQVVSVVLDTIGTYTFEFSDGEALSTITLNAGLYLGNDNGYLNCRNTACHGAIYDKWVGTNHASALTRGLDGEKGDHFSSNCVSCHSTGYDAAAYNWGFDDWPFQFPDSLYEGQADAMAQAYPDAMNRANIQCESCHGPGSEHFGDASDSKIAFSLSSKVCAYCHDSGTHHVYPAQFDVSKHANMTAGQTRSGCTQCHNGEGFIDYIKSGKTVTPGAKSENISIACATCHDPHDATNPHQLRTVTATLENGYEIADVGNGGLCMNCHKSRRDAVDYTDNYLSNISTHYGAHHGPQADIIAGQNMPSFGKETPSTKHLQVTPDACVTCHMYPGVVDENNQVVLSGSHSFNMSTPEGVDNMAACTQCHTGTDAESFDAVTFALNGRADLDGDGVAEGLQAEVEGMVEEIEMRLPPLDSPDVVMDSSWTLDMAKAYYIVEAVKDDKSYGIHNPKFITSLLQQSMEALGYIYTSVEKADDMMPSAFNIEQNYPNPFNPSTNIKFAIPENSNVRLIIFDALGREVEELINEQLQPGNYNVTWNASRYSSGVYFYQMEANNFSIVKKMLYLK